MGFPIAISRPDAVRAAGRQAENSDYRISWLGRLDPERAELDQFIEDVFFDTYQAHVSHFCDTLIGCRDSNGKWIAALGVTLAKDGPVFLEHYLDMPIECAIAGHINRPVAREQIAEVGNLAALHMGAARVLIVLMTRYLQERGLSWVVCTATKSLLNSFARLRIDTTVLVNADPARLPGNGKNWGTYYATKPQVMFGDIHSGYAQLAR